MTAIRPNGDYAYIPVWVRATGPMPVKEEDCEDRAMSPWGPTHDDELPMATT